MTARRIKAAQQTPPPAPTSSVPAESPTTLRVTKAVYRDAPPKPDEEPPAESPDGERHQPDSVGGNPVVRETGPADADPDADDADGGGIGADATEPTGDAERRRRRFRTRHAPRAGSYPGIPY